MILKNAQCSKAKILPNGPSGAQVTNYVLDVYPKDIFPRIAGVERHIMYAINLTVLSKYHEKDGQALPVESESLNRCVCVA